MNTEIRHRPVFSTLFARLTPGETLTAEADAMASMSAHTAMTTRLNGGFFAAILKRFFGGETLFVNDFSCEPGHEESEVVVTQPTPGDLVELPLQGTSMFLQPGAFVACTAGVTLGVGWAGFRSWFNGEGLFRLKVSGQGSVWIGAYGAIVEREVQGELVVDSSHVVAYEPTLKLHVGLSGGLFSSLLGGEGFVSRMRGRGKVLVQTRSLKGLAAWTNSYL